jgi:hypothetical protein
MSQLLLTFTLSQDELLQLALAAKDTTSYDEDGNEFLTTLEEAVVIPPFHYSASVMIALTVFLEETFPETSLHSSSESIGLLHEKMYPLIVALEKGDVTQWQERLEQLKQQPRELAEFYERFYEDSWDGAKAAMVDAARYIEASLKQLTTEKPWLLFMVV